MSSIRKRTIRWKTKSGEVRTAERWQARYVDDQGAEFAKDHKLKRDAQDWLDEQTSKLVTGTHVSPRRAKTTVGEWCDTWLQGYRTRRPSTVRQAETHIVRIKAEFAGYQLGAVRPSQVKAWCARLKAEPLEDSYVYALHARLAQLYNDAIEDGLVARSPCSRKTSPPMGKQRPYILPTEQLWALYDAVPDNVKPAILTGAFLGSRAAEACGLMIADLDLMRGVWTPTAQFPAEPLKTLCSTTPVSFAPSLALELSAHIEATQESRRGEWLLSNQWGDQLAPWTLQRALRAAQSGHVAPRPPDHPKTCTGCLVPGLPTTFGYHDLRHYFASMLIESGADVKKVQAAVRHASAKTTLDTYGHLWPDSDESIRAAGETVLQARMKARENVAADER
jgi:integrase